MNKELGSILAVAIGMQAGLMPNTLRRGARLMPTGKGSKPQDEQHQAILAAQAKREKRASKRLAKQI